MRLSVITAAVVAALVGIAGALAVVLAAADAVGATPQQKISWVAGLCLSMALTSGYLSLRHKIPIITAWSTPGAAVLAATSGVSIEAAVGAFIVTAGLILATAAIRPLGDLVARIPMAVAGAMLAGVLFQFVTDMFKALPGAPEIVLPLIAIFLVVRLVSAPLAMPAVIAAAVAIMGALGRFDGLSHSLRLTSFEIVRPAFDPVLVLGLAVPMYLVTMASQNLPGATVLRANGYPAPMSSILGVTGAGSLLTAFLGAHTTNLAAITAAICMGPDAHPDAKQRWQAGVAYMGVYLVLTASATAIVGLFLAFPPALIKTVAGLGLLGAMAGAMTTAMETPQHRLAAIVTFATSASGLSLLGIGSAFWGLALGIAVILFEEAGARFKRKT